MNKLILLVGVFLFGIIGSFQKSPNNMNIYKLENLVSNPKDSTILWDKNRKLTWNDFKGVPNYSERFGAITVPIISISQKYFEDSIILLVDNKFEMYESWVKKDIHSSFLPLLLEHEQGHFDISEVCVRRIRKEFSKYISKDYKSTVAFFNKVYSDQEKFCDNLDSEYDNETNFSRDADKQKEWTAKIAKMLNELEAYSSSKVVIKRVGW